MCFRSPAGVFDFRMGREREGPNGAAIRVQEIFGCHRNQEIGAWLRL